MTAAVKRKQSRPARIADEIEAVPGWTVSRHKDGQARGIRAQHLDGRVIKLEFRRDDRGRDVLVIGTAFIGDSAHEVAVAEAMKIVRSPAVPFAMDAPDAEVLAAVAGKTVAWRNAMSGKPEEGDVPRGGIHLTLKHPTIPGFESGERVLSFPSSTGWRAVRLDQIVKVW